MISTILIAWPLDSMGEGEGVQEKKPKTTSQQILRFTEITFISVQYSPRS